MSRKPSGNEGWRRLGYTLIAMAVIGLGDYELLKFYPDINSIFCLSSSVIGSVVGLVAFKKHIRKTKEMVEANIINANKPRDLTDPTQINVLLDYKGVDTYGGSGSKASNVPNVEPKEEKAEETAKPILPEEEKVQEVEKILSMPIDVIRKDGKIVAIKSDNGIQSLRTFVENQETKRKLKIK